MKVPAQKSSNASKKSGRSKKKTAKEKVELSDEETEDLAVVGNSLHTSIRGVKDLIQAMNVGTQEFQELLYNQCSLIYECSVCQSLFRSVANFISHKRTYCKKQRQSYNSSSLNELLQAKSQSEEMIQIEPEAPSVDNDSWQGNGDDAASSSRRKNVFPEKSILPQIPPLKYLGQISQPNGAVEAPVRNSVPPLSTDPLFMCRLQGMPMSAEAVYQTASGEEASSSMQEELSDLELSSKEKEAVLLADGQVAKPVGSYCCSSCDSSFPSQKMLQRHTAVYHDPRTCYPCPVCKVFRSSPWGVYSHLSKAHNKSAEQIRRLRPQILLKGQKRSLYQASKQLTDVAEADIAKMEAKEEEKWMAQFEGELHCSICGKPFSRRAALVVHSAKCKATVSKAGIPESESFGAQICEKCGLGFARKALLAVHVQTCRGLVTAKPLLQHPCIHCGTPFAKRHALTEHSVLCPKAPTVSPRSPLSLHMTPPKLSPSSSALSPSSILVRRDYTKPSPLSLSSRCLCPEHGEMHRLSASRLEAVVNKLRSTDNSNKCAHIGNSQQDNATSLGSNRETIDERGETAMEGVEERRREDDNIQEEKSEESDQLEATSETSDPQEESCSVDEIWTNIRTYDFTNENSNMHVDVHNLSNVSIEFQPEIITIDNNSPEDRRDLVNSVEKEETNEERTGAIEVEEEKSINEVTMEMGAAQFMRRGLSEIYVQSRNILVGRNELVFGSLTDVSKMEIAAETAVCNEPSSSSGNQLVVNKIGLKSVIPPRVLRETDDGALSEGDDEEESDFNMDESSDEDGIEVVYCSLSEHPPSIKGYLEPSDLRPSVSPKDFLDNSQSHVSAISDGTNPRELNVMSPSVALNNPQVDELPVENATLAANPTIGLLNNDSCQAYITCNRSNQREVDVLPPTVVTSNLQVNESLVKDATPPAIPATDSNNAGIHPSVKSSPGEKFINISEVRTLAAVTPCLQEIPTPVVSKDGDDKSLGEAPKANESPPTAVPKEVDELPVLFRICQAKPNPLATAKVFKELPSPVVPKLVEGEPIEKTSSSIFLTVSLNGFEGTPTPAALNDAEGMTKGNKSSPLFVTINRSKSAPVPTRKKDYEEYQHEARARSRSSSHSPTFDVGERRKKTRHFSHNLPKEVREAPMERATSKLFQDKSNRRKSPEELNTIETFPIEKSSQDPSEGHLPKLPVDANHRNLTLKPTYGPAESGVSILNDRCKSQTRAKSTVTTIIEDWFPLGHPNDNMPFTGFESTSFHDSTPKRLKKFVDAQEKELEAWLAYEKRPRLVNGRRARSVSKSKKSSTDPAADSIL